MQVYQFSSQKYRHYLKCIDRLFSWSTCTCLNKINILDYCKSLLSGIPDYQIQKLQRMQNHATHVVAWLWKYDHISPTLERLHWLPVKDRILFKTMLLTYKVLNGKAPAYLSELLISHCSEHALQSTNKLLLKVPQSNTKSYGDHSFMINAPTQWNNLPNHTRLLDCGDF